MEYYSGKSINNKIAIGKLFYYKKQEAKVKRERIEDVENEVKRFDEARELAKEQVLDLYEKAKSEVGEAEAAIFEVHMMMLDDEDYGDSVCNMIESQMVCAPYAIASTGENFANMFAEMEDEYMQARSADIKDISERMVSILLGNNDTGAVFDEPVILVADDLAPSETIQLDKDKLLGFVTRHGSMNSHTAILARTMNIPALIQVDIKPEWHGKEAVLDGYSALLTIEPDESALFKAREQVAQDNKKEELLKELKGKETVTKSGQKVKLYANIGNVADTAAALMNDAEGIGLFRSEFLYLESADFPTENEQFLAYKIVAENMAGKPVIIRTLDIGADKQVDYFNLKKEENPALGYRAIRICLNQTDIFRTQLRAILRASAFGNIAIMFPMIISLSEVQRAKEILAEVKSELKEQNISYKDVEVGVMIETPASVMISDELAKEVDFFSIGTNDLTQYTLAADRQNPALDDMIDIHHPAILKMIEITVKNAHDNDIWVGICGELGADLELTKFFLDLGVDELSVSSSSILPVREKIREQE
ncbi:phosphotransferase system enzyme I (PtsI) [Aequitasia blattaphilus]|uniref:Phosphoenolpyruvate-protein phosphotransferase n=1 Tax=Aequitasia blattaphilus TaxID=2949332 RepID=A0ABT1EBD8_9FIRM|nr:phosphoenolpyruvate--protein phosphotransferase [Aequitasia blattaphilus]MCP1103128.1 phosphoenolpyruvate--protein phosphotransferase [Aequitasia blattaphilus]MCR8615768.1 phosphoenolpyruvate--protein phosphotransferase [Aequitasia blattaphilus]